MLGAIFGDMVGSVYEFNNIVRQTDFSLFKQDSAATDDSICTIACMDWLLNKSDASDTLRSWCNGYPACGYGPMFYSWMTDPEAGPYNSFGNGAVMRISPVALWFSEAQPMYDATVEFTSITHNHKDSIQTAQLLNGLIRMAVAGADKEHLKKLSSVYYGEKINLTIEDLYNRVPPFFDITTKGTLLHALICFFNTNSFEEAIRYGVSIGGDSDTVCAVIGSLSESFYGFPDIWLEPVFSRLSYEMREVVIKYYSNRSIKPRELSSHLLDVEYIHGFTNPYDNKPTIVADDMDSVDTPDI